MRRVVLVLVLVGVVGVPGMAQPRHPIYLQYDGFVRNADASLTLAFGYYNLNQVDVTVEAGDDNRFLSGEAERAQQTVFLAGRHRFACVMVVPEDFDGGLQWQISFSGHTSTTTARLLDPRYALEEGSARRVVEGLDPAAVQAGVCLDANARGGNTEGGAR